MAQHDKAYKLLFSHPQMVVDLLRDFIPGAWVNQLDFSSLERVNTQFVSELLREREDDIIWRMRWGDSWLYLYLLLEFQSTVDDYMAVRLTAYESLLYLDLIKEGKIGKRGCLPPILPVVLYNGDTPWIAALNTADMIESPVPQLERLQLHGRYIVLANHDYDESTLASLQNLVAALFRLENSRSPEQVIPVLDALNEWLAAPEQAGLRRTFVVWLKRVLFPLRLPNQEIPEFNELQEARIMLSENRFTWNGIWKQEGIEEGLQQGIQQGEKHEAEKILLQLLKKRFDEDLPAWITESIAQADRLRLEGWIGRVFEVQRLEDIFTS